MNNNSGGYTEALVEELELVFDAGYLSAGGDDGIATLLTGVDLTRAHVLDFGCGLGGPALTMVRCLGATHVQGVDIEPHLVGRAQRLSANEPRVTFNTIGLDELPFPNGEFDIVVSNEVILHVSDRLSLFHEFRRVLKPGGGLTILDWVRQDGPMSTEMDRFLELDGLSFHLTTKEEYIQELEQARFSVRYDRFSDRALKETKECIARAAERRHTYEARLGTERWNGYNESWNLQAHLLSMGELEVFRFACYADEAP